MLVLVSHSIFQTYLDFETYLVISVTHSTTHSMKYSGYTFGYVFGYAFGGDAQHVDFLNSVTQ